ncbi:hypothetical protein MHLP_04395 [Candidatus Mycoplasma haematolamae str. Purdue]|uniref:Uncharacterized protein n=1 Tax=Mycoplasma haematolamae (strain Purdue) TaxID=1212765 RepID=I7CKT5_MYCHA|nr:hypothetical protein [Candidatus Mycoplasma haematolamae]AFO52459.1 hypothetical protein MHLP_04395 [Candidatus Mycoplasma haematolamae str. Purdue]
MLFSIHPGIWGAFATLATGITANVVVSTAYQTNKDVTLDFENLSSDIIDGNFDQNDEYKKEQRKLYLMWGTAATWYMKDCLLGKNPDPAKETLCEKHRNFYKGAPETKSTTFSWDDLYGYLQKIRNKKQ